MMSLKNFLIAYTFILVSGLAIIGGKDVLMIVTQQRFEAKVVGHADAGERKLYKPGGSYEEKHLAPVFAINLNGREKKIQAPYACKDGCHRLGSIQSLYLDKNTGEVLIITFKDFWSGPVYFILVMLAFLIFSIGHIQPANKPLVCELND